MRELFEHDNSNGVLLIHASNAFNSLNRAAALHNIRVLCPSIATYAINTYREPARLFIVGGQELRSSKGATQGDPLVMSLYAISLQPLITRLQVKSAASQCWYADDAAGCSSLGDVKTWWDKLMVSGPPLGYFPNPQKCWLIVKPEKERPAKEIFSETTINITTEGRKHLGAALGSRDFFEEYVDEKVEEWVAQVTVLAEFATAQPQSSYAAFVFGLRHRWTYFLRTVPDIAPFLEPLERAIADLLVPAITEHVTTQEERDLLELPQAHEPPHETEIKTLQASARREKDEFLKMQCEQVRESLPSKTERAVELATEKGASNWLTVIPIKEVNFNLNKREFRDAIKLRYDWEMADLPAMCTCGDLFTVDNAMVCRHGGLIIQRRNEIRDLEAEMLHMVCTDVETEPVLQEITGEELNRGANKAPDARLDVHARGFWDRQQSAFFDVRVCHPNAESYRELSPKQIFQLHENEKKRQYSRRVLKVEQGTFTPLVFTSTGGIPMNARDSIAASQSYLR
ncbi:unnamed protein product [Porites lobata]|uniref:SWIM-type domain-containing protein n=1 Tax=Porites lobata TaxID=104759 RepID=A0ABN8PPL7_9CNID|nr:unnamed protein product [Porites lobata]